MKIGAPLTSTTSRPRDRAKRLYRGLTIPLGAYEALSIGQLSPSDLLLDLAHEYQGPRLQVLSTTAEERAPAIFEPDGFESLPANEARGKNYHPWLGLFL